MNLKVILIVALLKSSHSVTIDCQDYRVELYKDNWKVSLTKKLYSCHHASVSSKCGTTKEVLAVSGLHMPNKSNSDVKMLYFNPSKRARAIPRNIGKFYENLEVLRMPSSGITKVAKEDFESIPKLKLLYLGENKIKYLPKDVFKYVPEIKFLAINSNPITNIGSSTFSSLPKLVYLSAYKLSCAKKWYESRKDRRGVEKIIFELRRRCPATRETDQTVDDVVEEVDLMELGEQMQPDVLEKCASKYDVFKDILDALEKKKHSDREVSLESVKVFFDFN